MNRFVFLVACAAVSSLCAQESNWNQFRGPLGNGQTSVTGLPMTWSETENVRWKIPIHGKGWSSPVVWEDRIWVTTASEDGKRMSVVCVDFESGKVLHDLLLYENEKPRFCHPKNSYASPTPYLEDGRVYVHFGSYGTCCLDAKTGKKLWDRRDIECNHWRAPGSSPIVHGDLLFVAYDGYDQQFVLALNKHTGETVWRTDRDINYGTDNGDRMKAYSTAKLIEHDGRYELISPSAVATIAYAPKTGKELWKVYHGGMNAAPRPLFAHGLVYITGGSGQSSLIAVRPGGSGDVTGSHVVWGNGRSTPKRSSQIIVGDLMFMITDDGIAVCLEAKTGKEIWKERLRGEFWASPLYADGRIYGFSKEGKSPVFAAKDTFELIATNELPEGIWGSPAVVGKSMIVRTRGHLYRLQVAK